MDDKKGGLADTALVILLSFYHIANMPVLNSEIATSSALGTHVFGWVAVALSVPLFILFCYLLFAVKDKKRSIISLPVVYQVTGGSLPHSQWFADPRIQLRVEASPYICMTLSDFLSFYRRNRTARNSERLLGLHDCFAVARNTCCRPTVVPLPALSGHSLTVLAFPSSSPRFFLKLQLLQ